MWAGGGSTAIAGPKLESLAKVRTGNYGCGDPGVSSVRWGADLVGLGHAAVGGYRVTHAEVFAGNGVGGPRRVVRVAEAGVGRVPPDPGNRVGSRRQRGVVDG